MTSLADQKAYLLQLDNRDQLRLGFDSGPWITAYRNVNTETENSGIFCALIPSVSLDDALREPSWDLRIGSGMPGCTVRYEGDSEVTSYDRFGDHGGIEPLIILRSFHGVRERYVEVLEEFRLFHNLYHDCQSDQYIKFDDNDDEEVILTVEPQVVKVRLKEVRQFLALKEMHLAVYIDSIRFSPLPINEIDSAEREDNYQGQLVRYSFHAMAAPNSSRGKHQSCSLLLGKWLIPPFPKERSGKWPYESSKQEYEEFVIGQDPNGDPVSYSCEPDRLANYFGANPQAPHYLTPVFFRREVLGKYYANPAKYTVGDGGLTCGALWDLRMDNNHERYVIVYLGDLGSLSHTEQLYWKSFNIPPEGTISSVAYRRHFGAEFANAEKADLLFKYSFERFQQAWHDRFGWRLFRPFTPEDEHLFKGLRIPLTNDQGEFDPQVLALTKLLIDSLNEPEIEKELEKTEPGWKSIAKFDAFLRVKKLPDREEHVKFLRELQELRSTGAGHYKGKEYEKVAARFGIGSKDLRLVFEEILRGAIAFLESLTCYFLG